ncbi:hypothetical protein M8J75_002515 [Diaphorina citri]|nr:hypothetical protein M8J75_002515 [Diaphorina citri]KAI5755721.1 hypothetical protein M8J77_019195 [Diaphorina citri]
MERIVMLGHAWVGNSTAYTCSCSTKNILSPGRSLDCNLRGMQGLPRRLTEPLIHLNKRVFESLLLCKKKKKKVEQGERGYPGLNIVK